MEKHENVFRLLRQRSKNDIQTIMTSATLADSVRSIAIRVARLSSPKVKKKFNLNFDFYLSILFISIYFSLWMPMQLKGKQRAKQHVSPNKKQTTTDKRTMTMTTGWIHLCRCPVNYNNIFWVYHCFKYYFCLFVCCLWWKINIFIINILIAVPVKQRLVALIAFLRLIIASQENW